MQIVVNDSSALIDIKKGGLLKSFLSLQLRLVIADSLLADELLSFTKRELLQIRGSLTVVTLDGAEMDRVRDMQFTHPALSLHDCTAFVLTQRSPDCILLTGDRRLRVQAEEAGVECHGVLWVVEQLLSHRLTPFELLTRALNLWMNDPTVRLPRPDLIALLARIKRLSAAD